MGQNIEYGAASKTAADDVSARFGVDAFRDRSVESAHTQQEIATANRLQTRVIDLETRVRGFVISKNTRDLGPWRAAQAMSSENSQPAPMLAAA